MKIEKIGNSEDELEYLSPLNSETEFSSGFKIKQRSQINAEVQASLMMKDVGCQTIITGDVISLNLYHGNIPNGNMCGMATLKDFSTNLDIIQGNFLMT